MILTSINIISKNSITNTKHPINFINNIQNLNESTQSINNVKHKNPETLPSKSNSKTISIYDGS